MTTPARIEANRRNALKSTGPRTPHGKAIASRNALRCGFRSRYAVLPCEDPAEFHEFLARLRAEFSPTTTSDHAMLDQMAVSYWRLGRLQRIETEIYAIRWKESDLATFIRQTLSPDEKPEPDPPSGESNNALGWAYIRGINSDRALISLYYFEARLERSFLRAMRELNNRTQSSPLLTTNRLRPRPPEPIPVPPVDINGPEDIR